MALFIAGLHATFLAAYAAANCSVYSSFASSAFLAAYAAANNASQRNIYQTFFLAAYAAANAILRPAALI